MRVLLPLSLLLCTSAWADPCDGPVPSAEHNDVDTWIQVHKAFIGSAVATDAEASEVLCSTKPCGPNERFSLISSPNSDLALVIRNPTTYSILKLPVAVPPTVWESSLTQLRPDLLQATLSWEEFGREMFCEKEDMDENGDCRDGVSATVSMGYTYQELLISPISQTVQWTKECIVGEDTPSRPPLLRHTKGAIGYQGCRGSDRTEWFRFKGGRCVAEAPRVFKANIRLARKLAQSGDFVKAIAVFDGLVQGEPRDAKILGERGYLHLKAEQFSLAKTDLFAALKALPTLKTQGVVYYNIGLVHLAQDNAKAALSAFQTANRLRPSKAAKSKIKSTQAVLKQGQK